MNLSGEVERWNHVSLIFERCETITEASEKQQGALDSWPKLYCGIFLSPPFTARIILLSSVIFNWSHQNVLFSVVCYFLKIHTPIWLSFLQTACVLDTVVKSFLKGSASFNPAELGAFPTPSYWETVKGVLHYHTVADPFFYLPYFWDDEKSRVVSTAQLKLYFSNGTFHF